jgi:hypothetical protein
LLGRIEWAAVGKQVFPGRPAITPQIAMKPATLCFVFDPGFVRSAYVRLCVDSERFVTSGRTAVTLAPGLVLRPGTNSQPNPGSALIA